MGRSVTVTGRGRASADYDEATLRLTATARAASPSDATARATYAMSGMREALVRGGVGESSLSTTNVSLSPVHDPWPTVVAYEASLSLAAKLSELSHVGSLLVGAIDAGGDGARIDGITFSHSDPAVVENAAREAAFADARVKAEQYARLAGQSLGEVRHVAESEFGGVPVPQRVIAAAVNMGAVPIDGGEGSVTAVVIVSWSLVPADGAAN